MIKDCSDACGWIAGIVGCFAFGSFGVPFKSEAANSVNGGRGPDMFVLQTYKSGMFFLTCWSTLLLGETFFFSPWGLLSGLLWVTGGTAGIFGVRNAGLAISVGTWSGVTIICSYFWGLLIFEEHVKSFMFTFLGIFTMILGLAGMTYYSSPLGEESLLLPAPTIEEYSEDDAISVMMESSLRSRLLDAYDNVSQRIDVSDKESRAHSLQLDRGGYGDSDEETDEEYIKFLGMRWKRRVLGLICAASDGVLGGSALVPMHYAGVHSMTYVLSFGIGAGIVTLSGWILRYLYNVLRTGSLRSGYKALPSMYIKKLWLPGSLAGTLWSIGNVGNILSVAYLGEGVGMTVVQGQLLVSGLWGIFYYGEIDGPHIIGWGISAVFTLLSIAFLGHEHRH